jgi:hypothetical protein
MEGEPDGVPLAEIVDSEVADDDKIEVYEADTDAVLERLTLNVIELLEQLELDTEGDDEALEACDMLRHDDADTLGVVDKVARLLGGTVGKADRVFEEVSHDEMDKDTVSVPLEEAEKDTLGDGVKELENDAVTEDDTDAVFEGLTLTVIESLEQLELDTEGDVEALEACEELGHDDAEILGVVDSVASKLAGTVGKADRVFDEVSHAETDKETVSVPLGETEKDTLGDSVNELEEEMEPDDDTELVKLADSDEEAVSDTDLDTDAKGDIELECDVDEDAEKKDVKLGDDDDVDRKLAGTVGTAEMDKYAVKEDDMVTDAVLILEGENKAEVEGDPVILEDAEIDGEIDAVRVTETDVDIVTDVDTDREMVADVEIVAEIDTEFDNRADADIVGEIDTDLVGEFVKDEEVEEVSDWY